MRYIVLTMLLLPGMAKAADAATKPIVTELYSEAEAFEGYEHRAEIATAVSFIQKHDSDGAWHALGAALAYCDTKLSTDAITYASVSTKEEASQFLESEGHSPSVVFIDMACPIAYKTAAFLAVDSGDSRKALGFLDKAQNIAPFWAEPYTERAYLLRVLGDNENALSFYRKALSLANSHKSSAHVRAMAYRGIGFVLTEKGDLYSAKKAYEDSLSIEPSNQLAKDEIIYIEKLQKNKR